jgi:hypothetical protein
MVALIPLTCPSCNGKLEFKPGDPKITCSFCGNEFLLERGDEARKTTPLNNMIFRRQSEPCEGAFSLQVPEGWSMVGGIQRANLMQGMLTAQAIEAKLDFAIKSDPAGSVMLHWVPEIKHVDPRLNPGAAMAGMFSGNYSGMMVTPLMSPVDFLVRAVFPWAHRSATNMQVAHQQALPLLVENFKKRNAALGLPAVPFAYEGGMVIFTYTEEGITYRENAYTVIENMGALAGGMWSNKDTFLERAPASQFDQWQPIMAHIRDSGHITPQWVAQEMRSQGMLSNAFLDAQRQQQAREQQMLDLQRQMQAADHQIVDHRQRTNAEIQNDQYLNLMNLEEYLNPYTRQPELGSNQWKYRWVTEGGDEYYTDDSYRDPNLDSQGNRSDWKLTPVRPRFGEA